MDNVTHALAGCLLAAATVAVVERRAGRPASPGFGRTAALVGVVTAELPDADLLYAGPMLGMGKLGYLLHHRGHTHTVLFALFGALLVWAIVRATQRRLPRPPAERAALLGLALAGTLSHLLLDFTNSYGVHPFWPVVNSWFYGDAVFIIEPWLWIAALPALLLVYRGRIARATFGVALVAILAAAWAVDMVGRDVALAMTIGAALWGALLWRARPARRVAYAMLAWLGVEALFFGAAREARALVRAAVRPAYYRDVVLTPSVGDPRCFAALLVELDPAGYRVAAATVAPFPLLRGAGECRAPRTFADVGVSAPRHRQTRQIRWGGDWLAPRTALAELAAANCEVAAAMRFIRVPAWTRREDGSIQLYDLRYSDRSGGFAELVTPARVTRCEGPLPGWTPPRQDVLEANADGAR